MTLDPSTRIANGYILDRLISGTVTLHHRGYTDMVSQVPKPLTLNAEMSTVDINCLDMDVMEFYRSLKELAYTSCST